DVSIDLYGLRDKLCADNRCFIMRSKDSVEHIFSELYRIPDNIKRVYCKLRVLELLVFLSIVDAADNREQRPYFQKRQVEIVKAIKEHLTGNLECQETLAELALRFGISLTAMKLCFKGVYGTSIYAFRRAYRLQAAAALLRQSSDTVSVIASKVGYANSSKFASAFREIMGVSPLEYRNKHRLSL
ncbi:AraC family transcriptional regulator, partial [Desulfosporosinus sp. PR]|uniref:helix-turn-helix domain-containing protein n=1 Tax=Candidatus Desulfosporosinus nitrosoreducens TaxID=3401928 RepID=UPI0027EADBAC